MHRHAIHALATAALFTAGGVQAQQPAGHHWSLALGGYLLSDFSSALSLEDATAGAGISISPTKTLGMKFQSSVLRFDGLYRFTDHHAMVFSWYNIRSSGNKFIEEEFDWEDEDGNPITVPIGANVDSRLSYDIYKLGYRWSFYHSDKVELALGAGLHVTRFRLDMESSLTLPPARRTRDMDTSVPLPVFGITLAYRISPRWSWSLDNQWFSMALDDYRGSYTDLTLRLEYQPWKNFGLGVGVGSNDLAIGKENQDFRFSFRNRITGGLAYVVSHF